jgi:hypothetical protein
LKWFKHDTDASRDAKLKRVMIKYGMQGYGLYWYCLELIAGGVDENNVTFELEHDAEIIAHETGINYQLVEEMMVYMVNQGLFEGSAGAITCMKLAKRIDQSMTSNPKMRELIKQLRLNDYNHDGVMTESCKIRLDETRLDKNKDNTKPPAIKYDPADNIPEGVNANSWLEWVEYRKKAKKKISEAAARKQFKFLMEYTEPVQAEIINLSITNDYQGLFPPKGSAGSTGLAVQSGGFIKKHTDRSWADEM